MGPSLRNKKNPGRTAPWLYSRPDGPGRAEDVWGAGFVMCRVELGRVHMSFLVLTCFCLGNKVAP